MGCAVAFNLPRAAKSSSTLVTPQVDLASSKLPCEATFNSTLVVRKIDWFYGLSRYTKISNKMYMFRLYQT